MNRPMIPCARETDVLDLIAIGQWPARADATLAAHVASCASCSDLAIVASAITDSGSSGASRLARARASRAALASSGRGATSP